MDVGAIFEADDVRTLAELGFSAVSRGQHEAAETLFRGVLAARPGGEAGVIGLALVHLGRGEVEAAIARLRPLPPSDPARLFLAMALNRWGASAEARTMLSDIVETSPASPEAESARQMLSAF